MIYVRRGALPPTTKVRGLITFYHDLAELYRLLNVNSKVFNANLKLLTTFFGSKNVDNT
jgi:hypothetical protein